MSVNQANIMGRLGANPEFHQGRDEKGDRVTFSIATDDGWGDRKKTNWHNITAFGKLAGLIDKHCRKGDMIYVSGPIDHNKSDRDDKWYTNIIAREFSFAGDAKGGGSDRDDRGRDDRRSGGGRDDSRRSRDDRDGGRDSRGRDDRGGRDDRDGDRGDRGRGRDDDRGSRGGRDDDRDSRGRSDDRGGDRGYDRNNRSNDPIDDEIPF